MHRCEPVQLSIKTVGTHVPANALFAAVGEGCMGVVPHAAAMAAPNTMRPYLAPYAQILRNRVCA